MLRTKEQPERSGRRSRGAQPCQCLQFLSFSADECALPLPFPLSSVFAIELDRDMGVREALSGAPKLEAPIALMNPRCVAST